MKLSKKGRLFTVILFDRYEIDFMVNAFRVKAFKVICRDPFLVNIYGFGLMVADLRRRSC